MSTPVITPQQTLNDLMNAMHSHTVKLTYSFIVVVFLLVSLMGFGGYLAVRHYDNLLAKAEAHEAQYQKDLAAAQAQWAQDRQALQQANDQVNQLQARISARNAQPLPKPIQEGLRSDASIEAVAGALSFAYTGTSGWTPPLVLPDNKSLAISDSDAKLIISDKVDLGKKTKDLEDLGQINTILNNNNSILNNDLNQCQNTLSESNKVIAEYKKIAVKSKFRKFLDGTEKVALVLLGGIIGHVI